MKRSRRVSPSLPEPVAGFEPVPGTTAVDPEGPFWTLGPADPGDATDLAALAALTFPLACPAELTARQIAEFIESELKPSDFARYLAAPGNIVLLARDRAGDPVGYVLALPGRGVDPEASENVRGSRPVYLSKCYAAPRAQGSGLSAALMESLVDDAARRGHDSVWLGTNDGNARARRFYEKHGFELIGARTFVVGGVQCRDVVYERLIGAES